MTSPALRPLPWLADFERDALAALDELLRGVADIALYERAEASEVLVTYFAGLPGTNADRHRLDEALTSWLRARRHDGPEVRRGHGVRRYVDEVLQALTAVYRLRLRGTARWLRDEFGTLQVWLGSLYEGPSEDPAGELWRVMALMQEDRRFLGDWYRLCEEAGRSLPEHYLSLGLLGLRYLPAAVVERPYKHEASGRLSQELVRGLFRWAARLDANDPSRAAFERQVLALMALFPRAPNRWRELIVPFLRAPAGAPLAEWLERAGVRVARANAQPAASGLRTPPLAPVKALVARLAHEPAARLTATIERLVDERRRYAESTGDAEYLVKTACNIADSVMRQDPSRALALALLGNRWEPSNPYTWTTWGRALAASDKKLSAEMVLWEATRRFPDNVVARTALAHLLAQQGRSAEAEALFRETMQRFPHNDVAPHALAFWLVRWRREREAAELAADIAHRFPPDVYTRRLIKVLNERKAGRDVEVPPPPNGFWETHVPDDERLHRDVTAAHGAAYVRESAAAYDARYDDLPLAAEGTEPPATRAHDQPKFDDMLNPRWATGARVGQADLRLRAGLNGRLRTEALHDLHTALSDDPEYVYPRVVLCLHDEPRRALARIVSAFPGAYPLRFLVARETGDTRTWDHLTVDFHEHAYLTLLGRLATGAANGQAGDVAHRLHAWATNGATAHGGFEAFVATRVRSWLFPGDAEPRDAATLAARLAEHAAQIEGLVQDGLKRTTDERAMNFMPIGRGAGLAPARS